MIEQASLVIGNDNFAVKENSFLGYALNQNLYVPREMDVVRATTATLVNSEGLIEPVAYNLLQRSQEFENAVWPKIALTVASNATTAPNGTLTADKLVENTSNTNHYLSQVITNQNSLFTYSVYAKKAERDFLFINAFATSPNNFTYVPSAYFNLSNGTIGTVSNCNASILDVGNGWYRCTIQCTSIFAQTSANVAFYNYIAIANNNNSYLGDGTSGIFIWGAQLVTGTSAKEYFPTTDRLDVPRVDYSNGTPSILVEPQRTNVALRSEEFNDATWTTNGLNVTVSSNSTTAPDGNSTADSILTTTTNGLHYVQQRTGSAIAGTTYTMSVYVKKLGYDCCQIVTSNTGTGVGTFRFSTKTLTITGPQIVANSGKVTEMVDGWFRIQISILPTSSVTWRWSIQCLNDSAQENFTGDITKGLYVWGFQFEVGSNATSYIPTVASTVTRNTDVISKTAISSLIGQTDGTLFFEVKGFSDGNPDFQFITLNDGTTNNQIGFSYNAGGIIQGYFRINSVTNTINSSISKTLNSKIILKYSSNNYKLFINGVLIGSGTSASGFSSPLTTFKASQGNNSGNYNGNIKTIAIYKTALTDTECINLTTL